MTKLFIFDLDGVLLDSETLYRKINFELFEDLGAEITNEEYNSFIGISGEKMWDYIKRKGNLKQSISELRALERERKFEGLTRNELISNKGLLELLDKLKSMDIHCAIASSGMMKNIKIILSKLNVETYFSYIVSGEMPERGKPAPDIFLLAAEYFGVDSKECIVMEDSRHGTLAAKAAEMKCIGYINPGSGNQDLSKADIVVESLTDPQVFKLISA
ncbi:MAG: HAD family hydrolase [Balneola sp.]